LFGAVAYLLAIAVDSGAFRAVLQGIGSFFVGTVVVAYAYQYFLHEEIEDRTVAKLDEVLERRIDRVVLDASRYGFAGFVNAAPRRAFEGLGPDDELLWLDTYSPDLMLFGPQLREAIKSGARVRMLVIDPDSDTARMRAEEIVEPGYEPSQFCSSTRAFLEYLGEAARELGAEPGRLEVRCYRDLPGIPMYLHVQGGKPVAGITGFLLSDPSFDMAHITWHDAKKGMLDSFCRYFEYKWERSPRSIDSKERTDGAGVAPVEPATNG
jgi:hypothetical protein